MNDLMIQVLAILIATIIITAVGLNTIRAKVVVIGGAKQRKTGKWMIIFGFILLFAGAGWAGTAGTINETGFWNHPGSILIILGIVLLIFGKIVVWFQRP